MSRELIQKLHELIPGSCEFSPKSRELIPKSGELTAMFREAEKNHLYHEIIWDFMKISPNLATKTRDVSRK
jgi:hypothetical protein